MSVIQYPAAFHEDCCLQSPHDTVVVVMLDYILYFLANIIWNGWKWLGGEQMWIVKYLPLGMGLATPDLRVHPFIMQHQIRPQPPLIGYFIKCSAKIDF